MECYFYTQYFLFRNHYLNRLSRIIVSYVKAEGNLCRNRLVITPLFFVTAINPATIYLFKVNNRNTEKKVWHMFKVKCKNTRITSMTSLWHFYCLFWTYFMRAGRGVHTSLFYEDPPILPTPIFQILSSHALPPLFCPTLTALSFVFFGWMGDRATFGVILLNDIIDLYMLSLGTLVTEGPWFVFYATRHQVYLGLTHNVFFCWYSDLISHTYTQTQTVRGQ